ADEPATTEPSATPEAATTPAPVPVEGLPPAAASPGPTKPAEPAPPAGSTQPRAGEGLLPRLDLYFPEGELDLRVSRLINKVLFEGQVKYNFLSGDISAFLRYRYYGYKRT